MLSQDVLLETDDNKFVFRHEICSSGYHYTKYVAVHFLPLSCKTGKCGNKILSVYDRSPEELILRDDLIAWCVDTQAGAMDLFFSYSFLNNKGYLINNKLTERDIRSAMKGTAERLG